MDRPEISVIVVGEEPAPVLAPARTAPSSPWISRSMGIGATVLVHLLLSTPLVLGHAAHKKRTPDGPGSVAWASKGEQPEAMLLLDLSSAAASELDVVPPRIESEGIAPDELTIELVSLDPQPPAELTDEQFEEADQANEAVGDPAGNAALFGRYVGQVAARIERAWMRPRSVIDGGRFDCRVRVTQDRRGNVEAIEFQDCGTHEAWRKSLASAIRRASPLSAPPEPWLFTPTLSLTFGGEQYVANRTPEHAYEPAALRVASAAAPVKLFREEDDAPASPMPPAGDVDLSIVGGEIRWTPSDASAATAR